MPDQIHRDPHIQQLIDNRQWKDAFKYYEKKEKKGDDSGVTKVSRIEILLLWPDETRRQQGCSELDAFLSKSPAVSDSKILSFLDDSSVIQKTGNDKLSNLWERAADVNPNDQDVLDLWYKRKFEISDFKTAQRVNAHSHEKFHFNATAMKWMKRFPSMRRPFFRYILATHLLSLSIEYSEEDRKLAKVLAFGNLCKAANNTISEKGPTSEGRRLETESDLFLFTSVYRDQDKYGEALKILRNTSLQSRVSQGSWEIALETIELCGLNGEYEQRWRLCKGILDNISGGSTSRVRSDSEFLFGGRGDDWNIWIRLVLTCRELPEEYWKETETLLTSFVESHPRHSRLASIAMCALRVVNLLESEQERLDIQSSLADQCWAYFLTFRHKVACPKDLSPYLASLFEQNQLELGSRLVTLEPLSSSAPLNEGIERGPSSVVSLVNRLKLYYYLSVVGSKGDKHLVLIEFVRSCLHVYNASTQYDFELPSTDRQPGDDAAILAAMGLVHLFRKGSSAALLQSIAVLELLLSHSKHNYDALLLLIRLYMYVGAGSLAMACYERLTIKNLQYSTVPWILFTRISHLHPQSTTVSLQEGESGTFDPLIVARNALAWHDDVAKRNAKSLRLQLDHERWDDVIDCIENDQVIQAGYNRVLLLTQYKNIKRFRTSFHDLNDQQPPKIPQKLSENRDRTPFPNYEPHDQPEFESLLPRADGSFEINDGWIALQLEKGYFWDVLHNDGRSNIDPLALKILRESTVKSPEVLVEEEKIVECSIHVLQEIYQCFKSPQKDHNRSSDVQYLLRTLENSLEITSRSIQETMGPIVNKPLTGPSLAGHWAVLHRFYSTLELTQFTTRTIDECISLRNKREDMNGDWLDTEFSDMLEKCAMVKKQLHSAAKGARAKFAESDSLKHVAGAAVKQSNFGKLIDGTRQNIDHVQSVCEMLRHSLIEAYDGVVATIDTV